MPSAKPALDLIPHAGWRGYIGWAFGALALVAVIAFFFHRGELAEFVRLAEQAQPIWLAPALVAQIMTYVLTATVWWLAMCKTGHPMPFAMLVPLGLAKLFTDQVLPSGGVSGSVLVTLSLQTRHVPYRIAIAALFVGLVSFNVAYLTMVLASLALLWMHGKVSPTIVAGAALFAAMTIAIPAAMLWLKSRSKRKAWPWLRRFPAIQVLLDAVAEAPAGVVKDVWLLVRCIACQLGVFGADALTLWLAFRAIGIVIEPWIVFVAFIMASVAATIGPIPLGLGTFEGTAIATLGLLGVAPEPSLAAILIFRGLSFWLPMAPGLWLARREMKGAK